MRNTWLYGGLCAWVLCITPWEYTWIIVLCAIPFLYHHQGYACVITWCILAVILWQRLPVEVIKPPSEANLTIIEPHASYAIATWENGKILLYGAEAYGVDDTIHGTLRCDEINANRNFGLFDFVSYSHKRNMIYRCQIDQAVLIKSGNSWRSRLWHRIEDQEESIRTWLSQTLLHVRDPNQENDLIYASGMHIALFLQGIVALLKLRLSPHQAKGVALCLCGFFLYLDGFRDSLLRIMIFQFIGYFFDRESNKDRLGIAMLVLLGIRPYLADELVFVLPFLFRLIHAFQLRPLSRISLSFLVLIPIQFYYFHTVDIGEILFFPLYRYLFAGNFILALFHVVLSLSCWYSLAQVLLAGIAWLDGFSLPFYYQASWIFLMLWMAFVLAYVGGGKRRYLWYVVWMAIWSQLAPYVRPYAQVMMLDVGQGDCFLISLPFHQGNILIDAPGSETRDLATDIIVPALQAQGIRSLDLLIITHDDLDHSGSLAQLQAQIPIKQVITSKQDIDQVSDTTLLFPLHDHSFHDINENSILIYTELYGVSFLFMGDGGKECEQVLLQRYPDLRADVIKLGHHGSKTASSLSFLHQMNSALALISCGANNRYGHPHPETLDALSQTRIPYLDTPHQGAVSIKISNIFCIYETATHEFGIIKTR